MTEPQIVVGLQQALLDRGIPALTRWNRLEGRPRRHDFERALRADVSDALWMLARQWQLGEFVGDDAGSPVMARACLDLRRIDRYRAGEGDGAAVDLAADDLLEPRVERLPLPLLLGDQALSWDLRLAVGRRWLRLVERDFPGTGYADRYREAWSVAVPDPDDEADATLVAHEDVWRQVRAAAGRAMDGIALLTHLADGGAVDDRVIVDPGDLAPLQGLADRLRSWLEGMLDAPGTDSSWLPSRLEYSFAVAASTGDEDDSGGTEVVLRAEEYHHGTLDWHALQRTEQTRLGDDVRPAVAPVREVRTFLPTQVVFDGMPHTRWWAFEDRRTNLHAVSAGTTDVGTLMLVEFALLYANDWFVVPWTLPVGHLVRVHGLAVTTVFGERLWVEPAQPPAGADGWDSWSMFALADAEGGPSQAELALVPVAPKVQEGEALEEVGLVRDEMSNMVWGVERRVPLATGWSRAGSELAHELRSHLQRLVDEGSGGPPEPPPPAVAPIRYRVMNQVPENWLPFLPVPIAGDTREIQLQRGAMPRFLDGDPRPPQKVRPRTSLLSENLPGPYFLFEEVVPRAGAQVSQCWQRTRRPDGSVVVWYGARKRTGRGEGHSGLAFDRLEHLATD